LNSRLSFLSSSFPILSQLLRCKTASKPTCCRALRSLRSLQRLFALFAKALCALCKGSLRSLQRLFALFAKSAAPAEADRQTSRFGSELFTGEKPQPKGLGSLVWRGPGSSSLTRTADRGSIASASVDPRQRQVAGPANFRGKRGAGGAQGTLRLCCGVRVAVSGFRG